MFFPFLFLGFLAPSGVYVGRLYGGGDRAEAEDEDPPAEDPDGDWCAWTDELAGEGVPVILTESCWLGRHLTE